MRGEGNCAEMIKRYKTYRPNGMCAACGGACCKRLPGPYHPSDFLKPITKEYLVELLTLGVAVFDFRRSYHLRPPCEGDNGHYCTEYSVGACTFLTELGCSLPFERRPLGCRALKPKNHMDGQCVTVAYTQEQARYAWSRHKKLLYEVEELIRARSKGEVLR